MDEERVIQWLLTGGIPGLIAIGCLLADARQEQFQYSRFREYWLGVQFGVTSVFLLVWAFGFLFL